MSMDEALREVRQQAIPKTEAAEAGLTALQLALQEQAGHLAAARTAIIEHVQPTFESGVGHWYNKAVGQYNTATTALRDAGISINSVFGPEHPKRRVIDASTATLQAHVDEATALLQPYTESLQQAADQLQTMLATIPEVEASLYATAEGITSRGHKAEAVSIIEEYAATRESQR